MALEIAGLAKRSTTTLTPTGDALARPCSGESAIVEHVLLDVVGCGGAMCRRRRDGWCESYRRSWRMRSGTRRVSRPRCPYGNPIPGEDTTADGSPLTGARSGDLVTVVRIMESLKMSATSLAWLERAGLMVGAVGSVLAAGPDGTVTVQVGDISAVGTGPATAGKVFVDRATPVRSAVTRDVQMAEADEALVPRPLRRLQKLMAAKHGECGCFEPAREEPREEGVDPGQWQLRFPQWALRIRRARCLRATTEGARCAGKPSADSLLRPGIEAATASA